MKGADTRMIFSGPPCRILVSNQTEIGSMRSHKVTLTVWRHDGL